MPRDLGQRAQEFRERWLAPSGGWLSEFTILMSDATGIWDIIILSGIFVAAWMVIRTSPMEISMILALSFDLVIPLQYFNDENLREKHEEHLERYWPVLLMGCLAEGICYFLLHPDLFTLIVCIKTVGMTMVWLSQDQEGLPIRIQPGNSGDSGNPGRGSRGSEGHKSTRSSTSKPSESSRSQTSSKSSKYPDSTRPSTSSTETTGVQKDPNFKSHQDPSEVPRPPLPSKNTSSSSSTPANMPPSKHVTSPYKYLQRARYTDPAIAGMILAMNKSDKETAKKNMRVWAKETDKKQIERRNQQYGDRARAAGWPAKFEGVDSSAGKLEDKAAPSNMPPSKHISNPYKYLHRTGYTDTAIAGMILALNASDKENAKKNVNAWIHEKDKNQIDRRNKQYGDRAKQAGWSEKFGEDKIGSDDGKRKETKLAMPAEAIQKAEALMKSKKVPSADRKKILDRLKNPESEKEIQEAAELLKKMGISVSGPKDGAPQSEPQYKTSKHKLGEPDGKGGYRDIQLSRHTLREFTQGMNSAKFSKEDKEKWFAYLQRPFSRAEIERTVIPLARATFVQLNGDYFGGGPHRLDVRSLEDIKLKLMRKCGVDGNLAGHMILTAVNQPTVNEAQKLINDWLKNGLSKVEFEKLRKSIPDWDT